MTRFVKDILHEGSFFGVNYERVVVLDFGTIVTLGFSVFVRIELHEIIESQVISSLLSKYSGIRRRQTFHAFSVLIKLKLYFNSVCTQLI